MIQKEKEIFLLNLHLNQKHCHSELLLLTLLFFRQIFDKYRFNMIFNHILGYKYISLNYNYL